MFRYSIKAKFIFFMLLVVLLTLTLSYFSFRYVIDSIELELGSLFAEKQVLYDRERSLRPILRELALSEKLIKSKVLKDWALNEKDPRLKKTAIEELESFRKEFIDKSYFFAIKSSGNYYYNDSQNQYAGRQLRYRLNPGSPGNLWFYKTMEQEKPCLINVDYDEAIHVTKVWINCVVRYNGRALGVAGTGIDLSRFIAAVINDSQSGISNLFVDSSGAIQTHKDAKEIDFRSISKQAGEKKTIYNMIDDPVERSSLKEAIDELKSGESEVKTLVLKINGRDYMVALAYISQIGWFNITLMEMGSWTSDEIFTPVGILLVLALILLAVISLFLVKFIVLDRITRLEKSSREVTQGNFDIELVDESPDEIGRLNRSFVEMTGEIRANTNGLEEKIAARTVELKQANESKDRLFTILAHDLKGPIGNLATLFNDLSEELDFNSPDLISSIRSSTQSTYDLLESLLLWAQCQSGNFEFMPRKIPLKETAEKTLKLFELQARSKKIKFSLEVGEDLYVTADEAMLKTVFRNLINNAVKYSYEGGEITLKADRRNDLLEISVTDQGMGIPADILSGLFELNSLSPSRRGTSNEIGTGLGLVLCKDLIGISGGRIGVESKSEKGSRFWFTLPIG